MKAEPAVIREIERLFEQMLRELEDSTLSKAYTDHFYSYAGKFVRWTKDEYEIKKH